MRRLLAVTWLTGAAFAAPLSNTDNVKIGYADFTSFQRKHVFRVDGYALYPEREARLEFHRDRDRRRDVGCDVPDQSATPEPGYEWALGLFLVGIGCIARGQKNIQRAK